MFLQEQQQAFQNVNSEMQDELKSQLSTLPQTSRQLAMLGTLPQQMREVAHLIIQSNELTVNRLASAVSGNEVDDNGKRKITLINILKYLFLGIAFIALIIIAINNLLEMLA